VSGFQPGQADSTPAGHFLLPLIGDRLAVGCLALNQERKVRVLLPELRGAKVVLMDDFAPGQLLLVVTPGSEPGGRWFDSNPRN
jgi:hypothetical protein